MTDIVNTASYDTTIFEDVTIGGTHVFMNYMDYAVQSRLYEGNFYIGSERVTGDNPYERWATAKAWPLNELLERHILYFQQVRQALTKIL